MENTKKRKERIYVRVTEREKDFLQKKAAKKSLSLAEYVRNIAMYGEVK